ncbi:restless-like transposase [Purpureocillium lavendulum]|uniref:Restless-like transposase n=1 Tax=Purpureocillium lavendulum TaxID=1247861 RepID=A0AB34FCC8_9HYPO|nr:vegetative incompatibility het-e-1 [Purpureocillium lavendulum]KAJ6436106.1 restless-like transposase [Purpureocillium lavendulum]
MDRLGDYNPFRRHEKYSPTTLLAARVLSTCSWLISVVVSVYYGAKNTGDANRNEDVWTQSYAHPSSFTLNSTLGGVFCYFIANNIFHSAFTALLVNSCFGWAEGFLLLNFTNLTVLQFRRKDLPIQMHLPTVSFPLSWTFVALYWNGFMMVPNQSLVAARVVGSIFIWAIFGYGLFSLLALEDFALCFCLSFLAIAIGVGQMERLASVPELISPFIIATVLAFGPLVWLKHKWLGIVSRNSESKCDDKDSSA